MTRARQVRCNEPDAARDRGVGDAATITAMSAAPLDPVYLIGGTDRPKVELAVRRLRARVRGEDGSVEEFTARRDDDDGEGMSGEEAAGACNALGLFGGTRLLVVAAAPRSGATRRRRGRSRGARRLPRRAGARRRARAADLGRGARRAPADARRGGGQRARLRPARDARASASGCASRPRAPAPISTAARSRACSSWPATTRRRSRARSRSSGCGRGRDDHRRARRRAVRADRRHAALGPDRCARRPPSQPTRCGCSAACSTAPTATCRAGCRRSRATCASWPSRSTCSEQGGGPEGHRARARAAQRVRGPQALAPVGALVARAALGRDRAHRGGRARDARRGRAARPLRARARAHRGRSAARVAEPSRPAGAPRGPAGWRAT